MVQLFKIIFLSVIFLSCNRSTTADVVKENVSYQENTLGQDELYKKIEYFVDIYDASEDERLRLRSPESENYFIDDSLCYYMSLLDKREIIEDDYFRSLMGKLLEKKYLGVRNYGTFDPEFFAVYNTSILYYGKKSNKFALNIVLQEKEGLDKDFNIYASSRSEFLCIDSVIITLDKIPQMQNDSNHLKCMDLVRNNKTGGCKW